jgi:phage recombination protein Bet
MKTDQQLQTSGNSRVMEFVPFGAQDKIKLSVEIIKSIVCTPTRSGKVCTDRDAIKFMMLCQAQRLNPFAGDAFMLGYDGTNGPEFSLITAHVAFLKRAETSPEFDGMESGIIILNDKGAISEREGDFHLNDEEVVGGWAKVYHKGRTKPTYRRLRLERFNKGFAEWKKDPAGMIVKCAEADALRSTFPTLLGGLYSVGESSALALEVKTAVLEVAAETQTQTAPSVEPQKDVKTPPTVQKEAKAETKPAKTAPVVPQSGATAPQTEKGTDTPTDAEKLSNAIQAANLEVGKFALWLINSQYIPDGGVYETIEDILEHLTPKVLAAILKSFGDIVNEIQGDGDLGPQAKATDAAANPQVQTNPAAEVEDNSVLGLLRKKIKEAGKTEKEIMDWGFKNKKIPAGAESLEAVAETAPTVLNYLTNTFGKILADINKAK